LKIGFLTYKSLVYMMLQHTFRPMTFIGVVMPLLIMWLRRKNLPS